MNRLASNPGFSSPRQKKVQRERKEKENGEGEAWSICSHAWHHKRSQFNERGLQMTANLARDHSPAILPTWAAG